MAPEFFADEATGFFIHQGSLSITIRSRPGLARRPRQVVLPVRAAAGLAVGLYDFLKKDGD